MKLFFDTEFTGLHKNTTLISSGIVSEDERKFYAEFTDYDHSQITPWIKENVINYLRFPLPNPGEDYYYVASRSEHNPIGNDLFSEWSLEMNGTKEMISKSLNHWLSQFDEIQFVSDVCHYDFVLMIDLITNGGTALDLPENISPVCHDVNQDIAEYYGLIDSEAFDENREEIMEEHAWNRDDIVDGIKHNSLYDAEVIRAIWKAI